MSLRTSNNRSDCFALLLYFSCGRAEGHGNSSRGGEEQSICKVQILHYCTEVDFSGDFFTFIPYICAQIYALSTSYTGKTCLQLLCLKVFKL